jgi:quercetin dioxygenase-like cupin family protein
MATTDFEAQQLLKAYRKGLISDELFEQQMKDLGTAQGDLDVANVFAHRGKSSEVSAKMLQKTPQSQTMVFSIPAGFSADEENTHKGDQILYIIDGTVTARVSGKEQDLKAGDVLMIPAGAPHTLRTGSEPLFGFTIFAPPEEGIGG